MREFSVSIIVAPAKLFLNIVRIAFFCMIEKFSKESISDVLGLLPLRGWLCRIADSKR